MSRIVIPIAALVALTTFAASSYADLDQGRHTGSYALDYSQVDQNDMAHTDYLIGSLHGAIAFTSTVGNGATGFHWEFPLVPINEEIRAQIEEARDDFIDAFEAFVDRCDWQLNWFGDITYYNLIVAGNWKTTEEREAAKRVIKEDGAAYGYAAVENAIANWNLMFESLPQDVNIEAKYGKGLFQGLGIGTFYFDDNSEQVWPSGMVNNARITLPYIVPTDGFLNGAQLPEGQLLGLGCLTWMAADEVGCFALAEGEPCTCAAPEKIVCDEAEGSETPCGETPEVAEKQICTLEEGNCANQCKYGDEVVDMLSFAGMIGELTCVGTVPGVIFGFDVGFGIAGAPRGTLETGALVPEAPEAGAEM